MGSEPETDRGVFVVMPAFNEGTRIGTTLSGLTAARLNVVVVDDGSTDDTALVALAHDVWVLRHPINCGQGMALQTGIDFALEQGAQVIVTIDADGQHDPSQVQRLVEPIERGEADVVLGSRFLGEAVGMPWTRRLLLKAAVLFTRIVSRMTVTDTHNGFRALSRSAARSIRLLQPRMAHASELLDAVRLNRLRYQEVPVTIRYDASTLAKGQSNLSALRVVGELLVMRFIR